MDFLDRNPNEIAAFKTCRMIDDNRTNPNLTLEGTVRATQTQAKTIYTPASSRMRGCLVVATWVLRSPFLNANPQAGPKLVYPIGPPRVQPAGIRFIIVIYIKYIKEKPPFCRKGTQRQRWRQTQKSSLLVDNRAPRSLSMTCHGHAYPASALAPSSGSWDGAA